MLGRGCAAAAAVAAVACRGPRRSVRRCADAALDISYVKAISTILM